MQHTPDNELIINELKDENTRLKEQLLIKDAYISSLTQQLSVLKDRIGNVCGELAKTLQENERLFECIKDIKVYTKNISICIAKSPVKKFPKKRKKGGYENANQTV